MAKDTTKGAKSSGGSKGGKPAKDTKGVAHNVKVSKEIASGWTIETWGGSR